MYIDGQFVTWHDDAWIDVVNPATEEIISRIPDGRAEDARKAIDAADRAQPQWEALPAIERANWLRKISAGIRQRADEISALIVAEGGKIHNWLTLKSRLPPTISITWRSGRVAMKVRSCKAIARVRISCCLSVHWA
jgi:acyl-CoA reductase-like NAD-dependent aldehyde dehydrogenase